MKIGCGGTCFFVYNSFKVDNYNTAHCGVLFDKYGQPEMVYIKFNEVCLICL
jgi:hypothetical protein